MLWIESTSIHAIDAKFEVYKKYENDLISKDIILHHNFEEPDEIYKRCGIQRLDFLSKVVTAMENCISLDCLQMVLQNVTEQELSLENLKAVCYKGFLKADDHHRSESLSYALEKRSAGDLLNLYIIEIAKSFEMKLLQTLSSYTEQKFDTNFKQTFADLKLDTFTDAFQELRNDAKDVVRQFLMDSILSGKEDHPFVFAQKENLNTKVWRDQVADFLYEIIFSKKKAIRTEILKRIGGVFIETQDGLGRMSTVIEDFTSKILITDQQTRKTTNLITI